ncbi:MAG TPA: hypothetical protein PK263_05630 [bacterium]|nr:hypothetical protein [bacterium]HQM30703.1 hypothetical protein [Syntrophales bacterium]
MRQIANRAAIIVRPKAKFAEWVRNADEESKGITAEDIAREPNVYLVDDYEMDEEKDRLLAEYCKEIFEEELNGWSTDESAWPKTRDLKTFKEWFHVDFHSMVFDLGENLLDRT